MSCGSSVSQLMSLCGHLDIVYSLYRASMTHASIPAEEREKLGISDTLVSQLYCYIASLSSP